MTTITATDYNHSPGMALRLANDDGEVAVTNRGTITHYVVSAAHMDELKSTQPRRSAWDVLHQIAIDSGVDQVATAEDALFVRESWQERPAAETFDPEWAAALQGAE